MPTHKSLSGVELKDAGHGQVEAVFATLNVKDKDGDVTVKGAFTSGSPVRISAYNHASWGGALPIGKGTIHEEGDHVVFRGEFFDTQAAQDTRKTLAGLGDMGEWSYGFDVVDSEPGQHKGENVRFLKAMKVHEVSPVLLGAGVGTHTVSVKRDFSAQERQTDAHNGNALPDGSFPIENEKDLRNAIQAIGRAKNPAAARAHIMRRARALGLSNLIPDDWRKMRFAEHGESVVADLKEFRERTAEVMAMRAEKGKALGDESRALVESIRAELKAVDELLSQDESEANNTAELTEEYLRFIAMTYEGEENG